MEAVTGRARLRIGLVHNLAQGGARRTMREHQRRLRGEVIEFCLETAASVSDQPRVVPFAPSAPRLPAVLRPLPRHLDLAALVRAWWHLARTVDRAGCDVVLVHPCQYLQAPIGLRWMRAPTVYFCHEPRRVDYEPAASASVNRRTRQLYAGLHAAERKLDRIGTFAADRVVTNSSFTATRIQRAYGRTADPVPLGVAELFSETDTPERERTHLLSVGTLIPSKGHDLAIRSAGSAVRKLPLVVVAPRASPAEISRLERIARECAVDLELRVAISDEQLRDLYRGACATLYLSREEPFGLASLEAQACGSPVIVADDGGLPETMLDGETGWALPRQDTIAVARAIDALGDPALMRELSSCARAHARAHTWERSASYMQETLERACSR